MEFTTKTETSVGFLALEGEILEIKETSLGNLLISASKFDVEYWA